MTDETALRPSTWLVSHRLHLPASGAALDVACGRGRNTLWLARQGFTALGLDRDPDAVGAVNALGAALTLRLTAAVADLEDGSYQLPAQAFDVIVVVHYLHRPLFPSLIAALRPGGLLVYETFLTAQASRGKPTNPDFLLEPGELLHLLSPLTVLDAREGDFEGRWIASAVARTPFARS